jgi:hypothetical protein
LDDTCIESIGKFGSGWNRALRDLTRPVHIGRPIHEDAVEMQRGGLIAELVVNVDDNLVALGRPHDGKRPLSIDANGWPLEHAIGICPDPGDVEIVGDDCCLCAGQEEKQRR